MSRRMPWLATWSAMAMTLLLAGSTVGAAGVGGEGPGKELPGAPAAPAEPGAASGAELVVGEWMEVEPGVLQRLRVDGAVETRAAGLAGMEFQARDLYRMIREMKQRHAAHPDAELREAIDAREERYEDLVDDILLARARGDDAGALTPMVAASGCTVNVAYNADARPAACGPEAVASGSFYHSCGHFGDITLDSYAQGWSSGLFRTASDTHPRAGTHTSHSDSVAASVVANTTCFSEAYAEVRVQDSVGNFSTWYQSDTNYTCQLALSTSITGLTSVYVPYGSAAGGTWHAAPSTSVDSYAWYLDGALVGTGSSYSRLFSSTYPSWAYTDSHTLSLTVTKCGQAASASRTIYVTYEPYTDGGCEQPTNPWEPVEPCYLE
ncbi:MAG TPA: hypothetical protein VHQ65_02040 [Thermoanaerobaculia bacterium]|nr:hypothetical protein [Thermoanaerobaculia bacterium]